MFMTALYVSIGMTIGNYGFQFFGEKNWDKALERTILSLAGTAFLFAALAAT